MKWVRAYMERRAEDLLRRATGMPPRPGSKEAKRQARQQSVAVLPVVNPEGAAILADVRGVETVAPTAKASIIPKEYAEDVEFVETKDYSSDTIETVADNGQRRERYRESQVSDVEWEEIKTKSSKK